MKTVKLLLLLSVALIVSFSSMAQMLASLQQRLQDTLDKMRSVHHFKGLSAAVSYKNMDIWKGVNGDADYNTPMTSDRLIGIGSNTKTFVSAMMLKLYENGQVNLDDTIGTWLQNYPNINGAITIRQVLNHTSGIFSYTENLSLNDSMMADLYRIWTKEEVLRDFVKAPYFAPGTSWQYSNSNYLIAGIIEEQITGKPIHQLLRDSILNPNQLTHTFFPPYETPTVPYANFWTYMGIGYEFWQMPMEVNSVANAAGAIVSDAVDNVKFWKALFEGDIISKQTLDSQMLQWVYLNSSTSYGLGIFKEKYIGHTVFSHGGTWVGQINSNLSDTANDIYITVLSNQDSLENDYTDKVVAALYKVLLTPSATAVQAVVMQNTQLHPNPVSDVLMMAEQPAKPVTVMLSSIDGRVVYNQEFAVGANVQIDVKGFTPGLYIASFISKGNVMNRQKIEIIH